MNKIDVEIYIKKLVDFFENNPNDLMNLIGESNKELFYNKIKEVVWKNFESGPEIELTQNQIIDIVSQISGTKVVESDAVGSFLLTKYGLISMN
jgi:hypothetical protein